MLVCLNQITELLERTPHRRSPVWPFLTISMLMESSGTTLPVITRNQQSVNREIKYLLLIVNHVIIYFYLLKIFYQSCNYILQSFGKNWHTKCKVWVKSDLLVVSPKHLNSGKTKNNNDCKCRQKTNWMDVRNVILRFMWMI